MVDRVELEWGVKESFIAYLEALPDGLIEERNGAARREDVFVLPGQRVDEDGFRFIGTIHFYAHHGVLDVTLDEFRLERAGRRTVLSAEVSGVRIPIAELMNVGVGGDAVLHSEFVSLTDDGAAVLGGVYPPGAPLAPLMIHSTP
jgi:hypothetical protein